MIDFGGWDLLVWYTSILEEHRAVRSQAGMFDVSHMGRVWLTGNRVLTKPAQHMEVGGGQLCLMCLEDGGILDDLWVYRVATNRYLVVWNAGHIEQKLELLPPGLHGSLLCD